MRNNNNKGSRSNVNKHELVYGQSSSNARDAPDVCLSFVLLFTIFIIVVTQKLVLQPSKNVTAKCTETLSPPPCIQFSLDTWKNDVASLIMNADIANDNDDGFAKISAYQKENVYGRTTCKIWFQNTKIIYLSSCK